MIVCMALILVVVHHSFGNRNDRGPRHIAMHPTLPQLYTTDEQACSVTAYAISPDDGILTELASVDTQPQDFPTGPPSRGAPSEIAVHPSGCCLFASNRHVPDPLPGVPQTIACIALHADGKMGQLQQLVMQHVPQGLALSKDGSTVYAVGTEDGVQGGWLSECRVRLAEDGVFQELEIVGTMTLGRSTPNPTPVVAFEAPQAPRL